MGFVTNDAKMILEPLLYYMILPVVVLSILVWIAIAIQKYGDKRYQEGFVVGAASEVASMAAS